MNREERRARARKGGNKVFHGDIEGTDGLVGEAERAKAVGFAGKYVIHPNHIEPVNTVFSPSEDQVANARKVVAAWEEALAKSEGVIQLDGRMIDRPIAERARRVIEQAEAMISRAP